MNRRSAVLLLTTTAAIGIAIVSLMFAVLLDQRSLDPGSVIAAGAGLATAALSIRELLALSAPSDVPARSAEPMPTVASRATQHRTQRHRYSEPHVPNIAAPIKLATMAKMHGHDLDVEQFGKSHATALRSSDPNVAVDVWTWDIIRQAFERLTAESDPDEEAEVFIHLAQSGLNPAALTSLITQVSPRDRLKVDLLRTMQDMGLMYEDVATPSIEHSTEEDSPSTSRSS